MDRSLATGLWIGAAIIFMIILMSLPFLIGRQNLYRRIITPCYYIYDFIRGLWYDPRSTLFHATVHSIQSFCETYKAFQRWLGRFHARKLRPHLKTTKIPLLPLNRMHFNARLSRTSSSGSFPRFTELPFDIRIIVYRQFLRLFPNGKWNYTNTMIPNRSFFDAMAFIRTCKLVREELGPMIFRALEFESDAKYPFYRNLPRSLTRELRNLSLNCRRTMDASYIHHLLLQQLRDMQSLRKFTVTVTGRVLVDLDREFEHILRRFKRNYPFLQSLTVKTQITLATATDDLVLRRAMGRLVGALLPSFGVPPAFRASVWTEDVGRGWFRPATGWFCRVERVEDPEMGELPDEEE